jgi:hypothetical protein
VEGTTVAVDAVEVAVEDAVEDEARITLARPMQQEKIFVPILAPMCLTTVRSLQQIKFVLDGKILHSMSEPTMGKTSVMNCRTRSLSFSSSLYTLMMCF